MAVPSNRSPSPLSTRPTINPNLRTSESNSTIRKSFSGNPFVKPSVLTNPRSFYPHTPANSPADFGRNRMIRKEEKENDKVINSKEAKCKSSAKGCKNFMSPTISAASKFTPSPKKKILGERNEAIRESVEDIGTKSEKEFYQSTYESSCNSNLAGFDKKEVVLEVPSIPKASKRVTFSDEVLLSSHRESEFSEEITTLNSDCVILGDPLVQETLFPSIPEVSVREAVSDVPIVAQKESECIYDITMDSDSVNVKPDLNIKPISSSPLIAPLDADPSCRPYDPKTNYLSPRPQFLRYNPNRRIESIIMSENFSDTDVSDETHSGDSPKESKDWSSAEIMPPAKEEDQPLVSEPFPISTHMPKQTFETKKASKPWFFTRSKCLSLFLVLLIASISISVTDIPIIDSPVFKDSSIFKPYELAEFARHFDAFARNFQHWSSQTIPYLSKLILHFGNEDKLVTIKFCNLTALQDHSLDDEYFKLNYENEKIVENYEEDELDSLVEEEDDMRKLDEEADLEVLDDEHDEEELEEHGSTEVDGEQWKIQAEVNDNSENLVEIWDLKQNDTSAPIDAELPSSNKEFEHQFVSTSKAPETPEIKIKVDNDAGSSDKTDSGAVDGNPEVTTEMAVSEVVDSLTHRTENIVYSSITLGISSLLVIAVVATAFSYWKKGRNVAALNDAVHQFPMLSKKIVFGSISAEHIHQDKPFSQNWQIEFDMAGESCPSEMSSFQNNSSYRERTDKAQSHERKPRKNTNRESLASSSSDCSMSPSYGSFTTYERIPLKHAYGEEEIVTPVRRSSRIRNQVASP